MPGDGPVPALSEVLDHLENALEGESISIGRLVDGLGRHSFASLILVFTLISASPASAIPGITAAVAAIVFLLVAQMIIGRNSVWLPGFIVSRSVPTATICKGIRWLRRPVAFVERFLRPRLRFLLHRPWIFLPMILVMALTLAMPFMEAIPTTGSIASAVIALFAAGLLGRDGALVLLSLVLLLGLPVAVFHFGFQG